MHAICPDIDQYSCVTVRYVRTFVQSWHIDSAVANTGADVHPCCAAATDSASYSEEAGQTSALILAGELCCENRHVTSDCCKGMKVVGPGKSAMRAGEEVNADQETGQGNPEIGIGW
jgi:hypothetical protein